MRSTNLGSIGEMPPNTRVTPGFTSATASAAATAISENLCHSGSISKSQCDLLFGSFQIMTASIIISLGNGRVDRSRCAPHGFVLANENLRFRVIDHFEPGAAQHCLRASTVRNPPVGGITGVTFLNEIH